jgi:2-polyprenyl-6-methoxyphenol hydroxylase-like FAD-dependent oxidoreductase
VQPNALLALRHIGLDRAVADAGAPGRVAVLRDWRGTDMTVQRMEDLSPEPGLLPVALHRGTLHDVLLDALGRDRVRLGAEVAGWTIDGAAKVALVGGEVIEGDLLVGADGIRSVVRAGLVGDEPTRYAGYTCWRGVTARKDLWPAGESAELWGPGRRFGIVPVDGDRIYWFAVLNAPEGGRDPAGAGRDAALAVVADCVDPARAIVASTDEEQVLRNDIVDRPASDVWGRGPVTLLGDAAHAMTPNMGQGACQAIEDAVVLGARLATGDPIAGLRAYEALRRERTRWFVEQSWAFGRLAQWESGFARGVRDLGLRWVPDAVVRRGMRRAWDFRL